jgi:hypothetical protein
MNRFPSVAPILAAAAALFFSGPAFATGVITCETPDTIFGAPVAPAGGDGIELARIDDAGTLEVTALSTEVGDSDRLFECVMGPLPALTDLSAVGHAPEQAYVEHGLAADTAWAGFAVDVAVPDAGLKVGTDISVLAVDLDTADGGSEHLLINVQRADARRGAELVIRRGSGAGHEVARLPLADGAIVVGWPGKAAPEAPLVVSVGGESYSAAVASGTRARAVRVGYLGLDTARQGGDQIYLVDPTFVAR